MLRDKPRTCDLKLIKENCEKTPLPYAERNVECKKLESVGLAMSLYHLKSTLLKREIYEYFLYGYVRVKRQCKGEFMSRMIMGNEFKVLVMKEENLEGKGDFLLGFCILEDTSAETGRSNQRTHFQINDH